MKTVRFMACACCVLLPLLPAFGQAGAPDAALAAAVAAVQQQYNRALAPNPQLLNGPEYLDYAKRYAVRTGHQFFMWPEVHTGNLTYNGHQFANVQLAYDVVLDQVTLLPPDSPLLLRLIGERVPAFSIQGHRFVRVVADSAAGGLARTGFYEVLLDSTVQVLAKRTKRMQEHIAQQVVDVEFTEADRLWLKKKGHYYPISNKASVLRVLADGGPAVPQYVREHKLRFNREQREASAVQLAAFYSGLPVR